MRYRVLAAVLVITMVAMGISIHFCQSWYGTFEASYGHGHGQNLTADSGHALNGTSSPIVLPAILVVGAVIMPMAGGRVNVIVHHFHENNRVSYVFKMTFRILSLAVPHLSTVPSLQFLAGKLYVVCMVRLYGGLVDAERLLRVLSKGLSITTAIKFLMHAGFSAEAVCASVIWLIIGGLLKVEVHQLWRRLNPFQNQNQNGDGADKVGQRRPEDNVEN